jgi:hypothetical protein
MGFDRKIFISSECNSQNEIMIHDDFSSTLSIFALQLFMGNKGSSRERVTRDSDCFLGR